MSHFFLCGSYKLAAGTVGLRAGLLLLLVEEGQERHTRDLDDLEADTGNITLCLALATEAGQQQLVLRAEGTRKEHLLSDHVGQAANRVQDTNKVPDAQNLPSPCPSPLPRLVLPPLPRLALPPLPRLALTHPCPACVRSRAWRCALYYVRSPQ